MRITRSGVITASLVLIPPYVGSIACWGYVDGTPEYFFIVTGAILWWPFSLFLKRRMFIAGLIGMHAMMSLFLISARTHQMDDLGWILYHPYLFVACVAAIILSEIARKVREWIGRVRTRE